MKEFRAAARRQMAVAYAVYNAALREGLLIRPSCCSACGKRGKIDGHHADYSKPLDVEWLCRSCHTAVHRRQARDSNRLRPRCVNCGLLIFWHVIDAGRTKEVGGELAHARCRRRRRRGPAKSIEAIARRYLGEVAA